jgi:hypothetical protein
MKIWPFVWKFDFQWIICVKYAQSLKIWPFVWKFDFYWIFVWNMLTVWKYGHLCENVTFIGYLCEICSMCQNMVIWCPGSVSEVCAVSKVLCSVSDGHYAESGNSSVSDEEKGRRVHVTRVSYLSRREMRPRNMCLISEKKGDVPTQRASPFYLTCTKKNIYILFSTGCPLRQHVACLLAHIHAHICANRHEQARCKKHRVEHKLSEIFEALRLSWV